VHVRTKLTLGAVALLLAGVALRSAMSSRTPEPKPAASATSLGTNEPSGSGPRVVETPDAAPTTIARGDAASGAVLASARWGSGREELGHERPAEGNAEGPMSFALAGKDLVVLDQVNGRVVRYDEKGRFLSSSNAPGTVQDIAVGKDGTTALLDRLAGKTVTLTDANGRRIGELPLTGIGEPGSLTGIFVDGNAVYVEKEHGALVRIGTTDGKAAEDAQELIGRPSKDGALLLSAVISSAEAGRIAVNAFDRKKDAHRFARVVEVPRPAHGIVMLDTDARGTIYLAAAAGTPEAAHVACLDPTDGRVLGRVTLPVSRSPEESFRDFAVTDDGTIVHALRTDEGVEYLRARCP
jgi:sugar lactone lactonase YvrE